MSNPSFPIIAGISLFSITWSWLNHRNIEDLLKKQSFDKKYNKKDGEKIEKSLGDLQKKILELEKQQTDMKQYQTDLQKTIFLMRRQQIDMFTDLSEQQYTDKLSIYTPDGRLIDSIFLHFRTTNKYAGKKIKSSTKDDDGIVHVKELADDEKDGKFYHQMFLCNSKISHWTKVKSEKDCFYTTRFYRSFIE